jgi:hypothetical protein
LIRHLRDDPMLQRLVTVATFDDTVRAALAKNHLEAAGIVAVLNDELTVATGWALSTAVGGIKLQVAPLHVERAEYLLAELAEARDEEGAEVEFATSAETAQELAEERAAQREEQNPSNQLADRAWRAAVIGFLFWPLHFYVWWLLLALAASPEQLSRSRRWKVWAAAVLNLPLLVAVTLVLARASALVGR